MMVLGMRCFRGITATGDVMLDMLMAGSAGEVLADRIHMYVEIVTWHKEGVVHIAMLDTISPAATEMTGATGVATGFAYILCNIGEVDGCSRQTTIIGSFEVLAGGIMTDKAVDILLDCEIIILIDPAIARMACSAMGEIRLWRDAEIIQDILLADALLVMRIEEFPGPVLGFLDLLGRFSMAFNTGPGNGWSSLKLLLQFLELGMVSSRNSSGMDHIHR